LETAGREIAVNMKLTGETARLLNEKFVDDELYIQEVKRHVDGMLHK
jgi:hypothetical protein